MKTLVLQLARLGDIYQSWPTLNALKRTGAASEVHLLTRTAFQAAAPSFVDRLWSFDTKAVLAPMVDEKPDLDASLAELTNLVEALHAEGFERIINLSYSPFSASLTYELSKQGALSVAGYTRHADRTLAIPDDASAYFYAQVGAGKGNRLHVIDLFAQTSGVTLSEEDWEFASSSQACQVVKETGRGGIVVHLGASNLAKTLSWPKWLQVVKGLVTQTDAPVILVGSKDEAEIAEKVSAIFGPKKPLNLVGRTNLNELFAIVDAASLVIGGDSAPVQIASLTDTPVFNLSFPMVSLWETGPRSKGSRILPIESEDAVTSEEIVREALATLSGKSAQLPVIKVVDRLMPYLEMKPQPQAFEWSLVQALYMGDVFPRPESGTFLTGLQRLAEVNVLALEQLAALTKDANNQTAALILNRVDEVLATIMNLVPEVSPLIRWFNVERLRIAPMAQADLIEATRAIHARLGEVLGLYVEGVESYEDVIMAKK